MKNNEKGYTLIEIIVVLLMLTVLLATALANLSQAGKNARLDKDSEKLLNTVNQTKKDSMNIRNIVDIGGASTEFNNKFLGYALRLKVDDPAYYVYEVWTNTDQEIAKLEDTLDLRIRKNLLEWSKITAINPVSLQGTVDIRFDKLTGQLNSSEGFTSVGDFVEVTLVSKSNDTLQSKIYINRGGVVSFDPLTPIATP